MRLLLLTLSLLWLSNNPLHAQNAVVKQWKTTEFSSEKTLQENLKTAEDFKILGEMLESTAITKTLEKEGMVTLFAMPNSSFERIPEAKRDSIMAHPQMATGLPKYHMVAGRIDKALLKAAVEKNGGSVKMTTLQNEKLTVSLKNDELILSDMQGNNARILASDFYHKNGFIHIIDNVLLPLLAQ
ncbi:MAG: fasciclin domain-containing protein [Flavobacteriaceae bacterium]|nr:fasciclin domain-containing protein [Flavobacteriaceae bacterium]